MTSSLVNAQYFDSSYEPSKKKGLAAVLPFIAPVNQKDGGLDDRGNWLPPVNGLALSAYVNDSESNDRKLTDYLILGALSLFIHATVVERFKDMSFEQEELIEPVKIPSKVEISIIKPQPKPVAPPPPPMARPKPPVQKVVPLKPQKAVVKPKPVERIVEPVPVSEPTTVSNAPTSPVVQSVPAPVVEKVTQPSAGAAYLKNPPPAYPQKAMDRGWQGKVLMKVHVQPNGKPDSVSVLRSSGKQLLDDEAVRTVKNWTFVPAKRGSTPIAGWVTVPITFKLS